MTIRTYQVGGTLDPDRHYYIPRKADDQLLQLCQRSQYAYIFNASQTGKSSLIERTRRKLVEEGVRAVAVSLETIGVIPDSERWFSNLLDEISEELGLSTEVLSWWGERPEYTPVRRWVMFFQEVVLAEISGPIVIFIDEIDKTMHLSFREDFFGALRLMYNERARRPELRRLTFVLAGLATPHELLADSTQTAHNIWQGVSLGDLTEEQGAVDALADGLGLETAEARQQALGWILDWTDGHPYLTQKLCARVQEQDWKECQPRDIDQLVEDEFLSGENEDNNLSYVERELTKDRTDGVTRNAVLAEYERVLIDGRVHDANTATQAELKLTGVVKNEDEWLRARNRIYQEVFDKTWLKRRFHLSWREWWAVQPRMIKTSLVAVLILVFLLAGITVRARQSAQIAYSRQLAAQSQAAGVHFPQLRLLLALEASNVTRQLDVPRVVDAEQALRDAISEPLGMPLAGHTQEIVKFVFSSDEHWLATGSKDDMVQIWDLHDLKSGPTALKGHSDDITALAFSPDSRWLASGSRDNTIRLWNMKNRQLEKVLEGHQAGIATLLFSPDSRWLLSASNDVKNDQLVANVERDSDGCHIEYENQNHVPAQIQKVPARVWNIENLDKEPVKLTGTEDGATRFEFMFSPSNGDWLIIHDQTCNAISLRQIADLDSSPIEMDLSPSTRSIFIIDPTFAISPDGNFLATFDDKNIVHLWKLGVSSVDLVNSYNYGADDSHFRLRFSPDGQWLLGHSLFQSLLWNVTIPDFQPRIYKGRALISPDGRWLLSEIQQEQEHQLQIWKTDALVGDPVMILRSFSFDDISSTGRWLITEDASDASDVFMVWDLENPALPPITFRESAYRLWFSQDERWLIGDMEDSSVRVWDMNDLSKKPLDLRGHDDGLGDVGVAFSPEGRWLATRNEFTSRIWDTSEWPILFSDSASWRGTDIDNFPLFTPDGLSLLTHDGRQILVWDAIRPAAGPVSRLPDKSFPDLMRFSPDGRWLLVEKFSFDKADNLKTRIDIWDWQNREAGPTQHIDLDETIDAMAMSQDDKRLATASGGMVSIWDWDAQTLTASLLYEIDNGDYVRSLSFSPDGNWLLASKGFEAILAWNLKEPGATPLELTGHEGDVIVMTFSSDGQRLVTAGHWTIRVWDNTSESKVLWGRDEPFSAVSLGANGRLVAGYEDGTAAIWELNSLSMWNLNSIDQPIILHGKAGDFDALNISSDGRWLKAGNGNGNVHTWDLSLEGVVKTACDLVGRNFTQDEWRQYFPNAPYRKTCEQWPAGQ